MTKEYDPAQVSISYGDLELKPEIEMGLERMPSAPPVVKIRDDYLGVFKRVRRGGTECFLSGDFGTAWYVTGIEPAEEGWLEITFTTEKPGAPDEQ